MDPDAVFLLNVNNEEISTNLFLQQCKMNSIEEYQTLVWRNHNR